MTHVGAERDRLVEAAAGGDARAWGALLSEHGPRLLRMVEFRLDARLRSRIDASDVLQEAFLEATACRQDYFRQPGVPLFLWLRGVVGNKLVELHRHHLGTKMRDAARDRPVAPRAAGSPDATADAVVSQLTAGRMGPGTVAERREIARRLRQALDDMEPIDREVLALRHYEQLSNAEAAQVLGIQERAAAKRYLRALKRLKEMLAALPGGLTGLGP